MMLKVYRISLSSFCVGQRLLGIRPSLEWLTPLEDAEFSFPSGCHSQIAPWVEGEGRRAKVYLLLLVLARSPPGEAKT